MDITSGSLVVSKTSSMERACGCSYDNSRGCKILDVLFKVNGTIFDRLSIDLIGVEAIIKLSNEAFDFFRLGFSSAYSSSLEKNVSFSIGSIFGMIGSSVFSIICFERLGDWFKVSLQRAIFVHLTILVFKAQYFLQIELLILTICFAILSRSMLHSGSSRCIDND